MIAFVISIRPSVSILKYFVGKRGLEPPWIAPPVPKTGAPRHSFSSAAGETRTLMGLLPLAPKASAYTNSATAANFILCHIL